MRSIFVLLITFLVFAIGGMDYTGINDTNKYAGVVGPPHSIGKLSIPPANKIELDGTYERIGPTKLYSGKDD